MSRPDGQARDSMPGQSFGLNSQNICARSQFRYLNAAGRSRCRRSSRSVLSWTGFSSPKTPAAHGLNGTTMYRSRLDAGRTTWISSVTFSTKSVKLEPKGRCFFVTPSHTRLPDWLLRREE
jgi:hypothetical protein